LIKEAVNKITNVPKVSESVVVHEEVETKLPESTENIEAAKLEATEVEVKTETQELGETQQETVIQSETPQEETPPLETPQVETTPEEVNKES
jgi:hypothetical protein